MIIIKYRGGLGNQMFQYAFELAVKKQYPNAEVCADISHYRMQNEHNGFELENVFGISTCHVEDIMLKKISPYYVPSNIYNNLPKKLRDVIARNLQYKYYNFQKKQRKKTYYKQEYHNSYEQEVFELDTSQDWYLDGLWQDIRYFSGCEDEVREVFRFKNEERFSEVDLQHLEKISQPNSVGIHVRRGDFVNSKFDICSMEYYQKALDIIFEQVGNPTFFFFTDDTEYVEKEFNWLTCKTIINHTVGNSILDMEMLSGCTHKIISNSTFAFWSAWLGEQNGLTIAPRYSIVKVDRSFILNVPENWMQI